jgi:hypothetical protein
MVRRPHISTGSSPSLRCARRVRDNPERSRSSEDEHIVTAADREGSTADQVELLEVLVGVGGPAFEVGMRRDAHERDGKLTRAERLGQGPKLSRNVGPVMKVLDRIGIDAAISVAEV